MQQTVAQPVWDAVAQEYVLCLIRVILSPFNQGEGGVVLISQTFFASLSISALNNL